MEPVEDGPKDTGRAHAGRKESVDKSLLPKVVEDYQPSTTVLGGLVSGGGIIERIEDDVIHFRSGDRIVVARDTDVILVPKMPDQALRILAPMVLDWVRRNRC